MELRPLGRSTLRVPPLIFGSMARRRTDERERIALLRHAIDLGWTAIDTAPLYDFGATEELVGRAVSAYPRERVQILTKVGLRWDEGARGRVLFESEDERGARRIVRCDSRPESVRRDVEQSLRRLRVDYVDLIQIHQPDEETPISETMGALAELRSRGLVREIGVSNFSAEQIRAAQRALGPVPLASVQPELSLLCTRFEREALPLCREERIAVLAYSPLARGLLAGSSREHLPPTVRTALRRAIDEKLAPIAAAQGASPAAVALAWLVSRPGVTAAIAGASTRAQLDDLHQAHRVRLEGHELADLEAAFHGIELPRPGSSQRSGVAGAVHRARRALGRVLRRCGLDPARVRRALGRGQA